MKLAKFASYFYTPGEKAILMKLRELAAQQTAEKEEIVAFLEVLDAKVEKLYEAANDPDVPEEVAEVFRTNLQEIKDAAGKVDSDDASTDPVPDPEPEA